MHAKPLQSCLTLRPHALTINSPPGSSVHGVLQARILKWVAISFSRGSSQPRDGTWVSCVSCSGMWVLYHQHHLRSSKIQQKFRNTVLKNSTRIKKTKENRKTSRKTYRENQPINPRRHVIETENKGNKGDKRPKGSN